MTRNPLSAAIHTKATFPAMLEYAPSGAQKPLLAQVVPPSSTRTTTTTPTEKNRFEMMPARQRPNAPDMTNIAAGNARITPSTQPRSENADVTWGEPAPAIENASAACNIIRTNNRAAIAALEAIAATPQPPLPASRSTLASAAPNQSCSRKAKQKM